MYSVDNVLVLLSCLATKSESPNVQFKSLFGRHSVMVATPGSESLGASQARNPANLPGSGVTVSN